MKRRANALPTPASVPGAVDENISCFVIAVIRHEGLALLCRDLKREERRPPRHLFPDLIRREK